MAWTTRLSGSLLGWYATFDVAGRLLHVPFNEPLWMQIAGLVGALAGWVYFLAGREV